jgi:hypothetical protein
MRVQTNTHYSYIYVFIFGIVISLSLFLLLKPSASAATINVVAGTDAINDNNQCQLSEAIKNINDQAQTNNDCPAGNGNNDTINLPAGTVTLSGELPTIEERVVIQGQGVGSTTVSGSQQYKIFEFNEGSQNSELKNIKLTAFEELAVQIANSNATIRSIEIDGSNSVELGGALNGIFIGNSSATIDSVYIHSISGNPNFGLSAIATQAAQNASVNYTITNTTIENISSESSLAGGVTIGTGVADGSLTPANVTVSVSNSTFSNITSQTNNAAGIVSFGYVNNGITNVTGSYTNNSFTQIEGSDSGLWGGSADIGTGGGALGSSDEVVVTINSHNNVFSGTNHGCRKSGDIAQVFGSPNPSAGTITESITSLGGNISDDESCNDYFTQETDKNNITNLGDFLGDIANNGGAVPTIALLPGNLAIDGGVCGEGVPETDARGISRPQGKTCDSGAYEVEQAAPAGTVSGGKAVAVNVPAGVVVNEFGTVSGSIPTDNQGDAEYEFPLGLLSFELGVPEGSANEISLDFESDLDPSSVVARKYNPSDQTFTTLTNATITKITKDNKPTLRLTYSITDGQFPDLDNQANGTITDPIGLATEKKGVLANTGDLIILAIPFGASLLLGAFIVTYTDYRKHKKPLQEADKQLAKTYTYWHHLKTVTVPLFSYRLSFAFERRERSHLSVGL